MKKKTLLAILTLCLALSATAFASCKNNDNPPELSEKTENTVILENIAEIECGESATFSAKTEDGAGITFVYSESESGEYIAVPETFTHGEYYVKAVAAETENHKQTYSAAKKLVVNGIFTSYDEERSEEYDYGVCACGELIEGISFKKRVEGVQEIVVTAIENIKRPTAGSSGYAYTEKYLTPSISLGEIGEKAESIGEITLGEISLGNDINALDLSGLTDKKIHGEQNLLVKVTDDKGYTHNAVVPVLLITREIATDDELNVLLGGDEWRATYIVNGTEVPKTGGENHVYGYYKLTSDINYTATVAGNTLHGVTFDGGNHKITIGTEEKGAPQRGIFGDIYYSTVIKNLVIDAAYSNPDKADTTKEEDSDYNTVLASQAYGSTFENITVNYVAGKDSTYSATKGLLINYQVGACAFKDITINANGKKLGAVLCFSEASIEEFVFENFVINDCAGIGCLVTAKEGKVQPWDVKGVKGEVKQTVKPEISIDPASEEIVSVPLGEAYAALAKSVSSVTKITAGGITEDVTEYCNFTEEGFWFYESDVAAESDRKKNITLEVVYDSESFDVTLETVLYVKGTETAVYYTVTFVQRSGEETETRVEEGTKVKLPVAEAAGENERFVGWQTADGKIWNENTDVVTENIVLTAVYEAVIDKRYESVLIDECVLKTDCAEGTEGFTEESGDLAEGFEKRYIKTVTGEYMPYYSHKNISRYNTVKFAIRTTANYRFDNFGATDDPRV